MNYAESTLQFHPKFRCLFDATDPDAKKMFKVFRGGRGAGKCLGVGTPVLMFDGTLCAVEDIAIGDLVMGPDSKPRTVLSVCAGVSEMFEVTQTSAMNYVVNADHILSLKKSDSAESDGRYQGRDKISNIKITDFIGQSKRFKENFMGYRAGLIKYKPQPVPVDPYLLGLWLGDGMHRELMITSADHEIVEWLQQYADAHDMLLTSDAKSGEAAANYRITKKKGKINKIWQEFINLGVACKRHYGPRKFLKHIPQIYISNSETVRLHLLAGLIDTDGWCGKNGYAITQANERMANDIKRLADSLGFRTSIRKKKTKLKDFIGVAWTIHINGAVSRIPCRIERKKIKADNPNKDKTLSMIAVKSIGLGEYAGFSVDGDHLFCLADGTVTHNSWQIGRALCIKGARRKEKILCGREYQNSMEESVMALIQDQAKVIGLGDFYRSTQTETVGQNGTQFIYKGLKQNINNLKSLEGAKRFWMEEAHTISQNSLDVVLPSIRQPEVEILISYNPDAEDDAIHSFVNSLPPELVYLCDINWHENEWLPNSLVIQKDLRLRRITEATNDEERAIEQEAYDQIWMGKVRKASRARIFAGKCMQEDFRVEYLTQDTADRKQGYYINGKPADGPYFGVDWGFSADPTAACRAWICDECIYIDHEVYEYRLELDKTPEALRRIPLLDRHLSRADCARPETISHCRVPRADSKGVQQPGLNIIAADKWPDSVEDGITVLKGMRKIIMHTRCVNFWEEARYYSYKVDTKTGDVLADVVDKYNHLWDALRYALAPFIKRSGKGQGFYQYYVNQQKAKEATVK